MQTPRESSFGISRETVQTHTSLDSGTSFCKGVLCPSQLEGRSSHGHCPVTVVKVTISVEMRAGTQIKSCASVAYTRRFGTALGQPKLHTSTSANTCMFVLLGWNPPRLDCTASPSAITPRSSTNLTHTTLRCDLSTFVTAVNKTVE